MALDREYIKKKVKQAIEQLPSTGIVVREVFNRYNEKEGYCKVAELTGVLYNNTTNRTLGISMWIQIIKTIWLYMMIILK